MKNLISLVILTLIVVAVVAVVKSQHPPPRFMSIEEMEHLASSYTLVVMQINNEASNRDMLYYKMTNDTEYVH